VVVGRGGLGLLAGATLGGARVCAGAAGRSTTGSESNIVRQAFWRRGEESD